MKAAEFDRRFDVGEDISNQVDWRKARRPNLDAYDIEGTIFIRFAMVGRPILNGLAGRGQRRRRDPLCAAMFAHDILGALRRQIGFKRQGEVVADAEVEEFLSAAIWEIPVEDFVVLVGIDAGPRDRAKREMSRALAARLTAEFEIG